MNTQTTSRVLACLLLLWIPTVFAQGEQRLITLVSQPFALESGVFDGAEVHGEPVFTEVIKAETTPWMRIHFSDYHLGHHSFIILTSLSDGDWQRLDSASMPIWSDTSGLFNGRQVELTLYVAAADSGVFVNIDEILVADPADFSDASDSGDSAPRGITPRTICGDFDDRIPSSDSRVGRLFFGGCTGWLVSNGAALTAGHCGSLSGAMLEFNVPSSTSNGVPVAASLNDQYPVTGWDFEDSGEGEDYNVFSIGPNSNTGLQAHLVQGFFHMTGAVPTEGSTLRVTGYGIDPFPPGTGGSGAACCDWDSDGDCNFDCNSTSLTQQTDTGACDDCQVGTAIEHTVDTMGANSGSPIIWESNGIAFAIHTHGGCDSLDSDYDNAGTWLGYFPLQDELQSFLGPNTIFVDSVTVGTYEVGHVLYPFNTVTEGVAAVSDGGEVAIVAGSYPASAGNTFIAGADGKAMTLTPFFGTVTIGN